DGMTQPAEVKVKKQDLIKVKPTGMEINAEGEPLISQLKGYFAIYADDNRLSEGIKNKFQIKEDHVVPGDADNSQPVKTELGRQAAQLLEGILQEDAIVAVTGQPTMTLTNETIHLIPYNSSFVPP
ncbi:sugar-binding domain-containing protein, partial [Staphylococcus aureus]|uniref:sugar-binding domain-containing protein n=1 Tax=Staphylococcus aureus TaxID=1280 RepID=UPI00210BB52A